MFFSAYLELKRHYPKPEAYLNDQISEAERYKIDYYSARYDARFSTAKLKWDCDRVKYLKRLGWDLMGDNGQPLQITQYVCRVIEAVAKGIAGKVPEADVVDAKAIEEKLQQQASEFQRSRRNTESLKTVTKQRVLYDKKN